jgi:hypothetical protein
MAVQVIGIAEVLRHDRVERLGGRRQAEVREFDQQAARLAQSLLDVEGVVHVRVVDQPLPADRGARLLEVHAHDEVERLLHALGQRLEAPGVLARSLQVVDRAGTHDHEEPRVAPVEDVAHRLAGPVDEGFARRGERQLGAHLLRCRQELARENVDVVQAARHGRTRAGKNGRRV